MNSFATKGKLSQFCHLRVFILRALIPFSIRNDQLKFAKTFASSWPLILVAALLFMMGHNIHSNLLDAGISIDFTVFLSQAGFDVSERLIAYSPGDSYGRVILTGFLNTLLLAFTGLIGATVLGLWIGFMATHTSWSLRALALGFVELFRNQPKILILLVLFVFSVSTLPPVNAALTGFGMVLSNRALLLPSLSGPSLPLLGLGLLAGWFGMYWLHRRWADRGHFVPLAPIAAMVTLAIIIIGTEFLNLTVITPERQGFDYQGGIRISMQFMVMWCCLTLYHGAQIGEVVRGGIMAVPAGTVEAAQTLGLTTRQIRRLVIRPQALRLIFPPLCNQYINLLKNTSIAIAVGYSDLMSVTGTMINQTFRPIEAMTVTILLYVCCCLGLSWALNKINARLSEASSS